MKKSALLLLLLPVVLTGTYVALQNQGSGGATQYAVSDVGNISLFFCPQEDCEGALLAFIGTAEESIHCAMYEIDLLSVQKLLDEKAKKMEVEIVTDDSYLKEFNRSFVKADRSGLMHNKFCIIDGKRVSSGSMNPTDNDAHKNNNNLLLIHSKSLAGNYEDEFQELWKGVFKKGGKVANPSIDLSGILIQNYFCPEDHCADMVKEELKKAQHSIYFMTFSFTHEGISNTILFQYSQNVSVKGVMEVRQIDKDSAYKVLAYQTGAVRKDGNKYNLHHKVFIIDEATVVTGSFNPSKNGDTRNDENLLIIHDKAIAARYVNEFEQVWNEAQT